MKKLLVVGLLFLGLFGCSSEVSIEEIETHVDKIKTHAETAGTNEEGFLEDLQAFNEYLEDVESEFKEYAEIQIEANNMRIEGLTNKDNELISDSSWKQAEALQILDEIK